jgi:hypothetical protein
MASYFLIYGLQLNVLFALSAMDKTEFEFFARYQFFVWGSI